MNIVKRIFTLDFCQFTEQYFITRLSSGKDIMYGDAHKYMEV